MPDFVSIFKRAAENPLMAKLGAALLAVLLVLVVMRVLRKSISTYVADVDTRYRARKIVTFVGYLIAVLTFMAVFSDRLSGLTVAFGVAGAGIAFALQEVIASFAGWIAISLGGFYSPGDRVQLGGIKGDVIDISILRTTLMETGEWVAGDLYTGRIVRIANSFVFKEPVFNYSGEFPFLWDEITLPVRYGSDWRLARKILREIIDEVLAEYAVKVKDSWRVMVKQYRIEDANVEPMISMVANDNWIQFTVRYVVDYRRRRGTKDFLFTRILEEVEKTEGRIQLASATFELVQGSAIEVSLKRAGPGKVG